MNGTQPKLWDGGAFRKNIWQKREEALAPADDEHVILPLAAYLELKENTREGATEQIGVELQPGEALDLLLPHLERLPLVALSFPAFADGRSYSKAELLRTRHGYRGEIRATGDVLIDQVAHMFRVGFSTLEIVNPFTISQLEAGKEAGIPLYYQPAAKAAAAPASYAWRRISA
ncbi:DUF934 domain-containing protein [Nitratireductor kimnyeongensis]|uniref:DUF934 domain-containing protein n=1 Tax=Nitratireductor kimnyeongensis TaxID=430679 RepID=A0ABW0T8F2_9HYPH|nr:DUF934 domain-containing protein [Nitratireductor kimnyeongensis]QZZ34152.1 DUF934 domain-containing protein [Nitratireductor kimnyeongensis]